MINVKKYIRINSDKYFANELLHRYCLFHKDTNGHQMNVLSYSNSTFLLNASLSNKVSCKFKHILFQIMYCRLRLGSSDLDFNKFERHISDDPTCS